MNKLLYLFIILSTFCMLNATTIEVSLDGTYPYTTIQSAINASSNGDTVLVHPGRYVENIVISYQEITIVSNYLFTDDYNDITSTVIDADFQSNCFDIDHDCNVVFNGLSMINGVGKLYTVPPSYGGAINLNHDSVMLLENCVIENSEAHYGGGVYVCNESSLTLVGTVIRNNSSLEQGGGLGVYNSSVYFDTENLSSIFNNYGDIQDIYLSNVICNDIVLDTLSVAVTEPDGFFISWYAPPLNITPIPSVSVLHNFFTQTNADLYVSPDGDDANDGLTPESALRTIAYATRIIEPDEENPNTVWLMPGVYSQELNNQFFPVAIQSHTKLLGAGEGPEDVVIGDEWNINTIKIGFGTDIEAGNWSMIHGTEEAIYTFDVTRSTDILIRDIDMGDTAAELAGILASYSQLAIENCRVHDISSVDNFMSLDTYESDVVLNNIIIDNTDNSAHDMSFVSCINWGNSSITANNIIVTNNYMSDSGPIVQYSYSAISDEERYLYLNNFLFYDNYVNDNSMAMIIFSNHFGNNEVNNMTIANNDGHTSAVRFCGDFVMRNSILYNPLIPNEMHLWEPPSGDTDPTFSNVDVDYCLIRNGESGVGGANNPGNTLTWGEHNLDTDPLFRGDVVGDIEAGDYRWVQLSENSPCINAGTPDTLGMNLPSVDIDGRSRIWGDIIDMGAWEYYPGDANEDNEVPSPPYNIVVSHFPNPVFLNGNNSGSAFIEFTLPQKPVKQPTLEIFNIRGQKVRSIKITQSFSQLVRSAGLSSEEKQSGEYYSQVWDCRDDHRKPVDSGIYFYKVSSDGKSAIGKMMVLK